MILFPMLQEVEELTEHKNLLEQMDVNSKIKKQHWNKDVR